jgi:CheY-like chemotaxis protein
LIPSSQSSETPSIDKLRILIAEDNKINQKVLIRVLGGLGIESVETVDDGKKAFDRELEESFDVILMDVQMPTMDSIEVCRIITGRSPRPHPKPQVIFITAHVSEEFEGKCRDAGGEGFVSKPFNVTDIKNCLKKVYLATIEAKLLQI